MLLPQLILEHTTDKALKIHSWRRFGLLLILTLLIIILLPAIFPIMFIFTFSNKFIYLILAALGFCCGTQAWLLLGV